MTQKIKLFCILDGDSSAFEVQLDADDSIAALKKAIKKEKEPEFDYIPADKLNLFHVSVPDEGATINLANIESKELLTRATSKISKIFGTSPLPEETINVIIQRPLEDPSTSTSNSEKKRRADDLLPPVLKKKKWTVNGPIRFDAVNQVYYVDPAEHDDNKKILQSVFDREIVMLIGARASGKTTRLYRLITQLTDFGYRCLP
ncbi:hypothetical protein BCR41DRAFT_44323 [Lobosporangium transversale]|uniref:Crinkler effector protein N-terminal domain-containing protein n=1 Tax=Lobosporangium transversale TaxID=64571 RepID=A0A1Y2GS05_9FUNG|nr:hypothetical protein BCR41DRAFT_44323 [Lobosporangium transversale]ORZ18265.1 hypothetical protein BCR41DRAFT_44323 [Lobosporangium transversale]|eukprot:XP_021882060.1 hypothetical protein BCR41DRAFT_44323 [Lobosporangium transversale]